MKRICIDMDDVLADTLSELLRRYNSQFGEAVTAQDLEGKQLWDIVPVERQQAVTNIFHEEDFFADLPLMEDAVETVRALAQQHEVFIATAAMGIPTSLRPKYDWLQRHLPFIPPTHYIFLGHKHVLDADFLIDDLPRNLRGFRGRGILFDAPHNRHVTEFARAQSWQHVPTLIAAHS